MKSKCRFIQFGFHILNRDEIECLTMKSFTTNNPDLYEWFWSIKMKSGQEYQTESFVTDYNHMMLHLHREADRINSPKFYDRMERKAKREDT